VDTGSGLRVVKGPGGFATVSNGISLSQGPVLSSFPPPPGASFGFFGRFPPVSRWTQLLHLAVLRTQFTIPIYWCVVCICWAFNHFQESAERERRTLELEARLTDANLRALKMQLQPHFLFNTLNAISSLIHENPKVADDMIGSLSQFLRATLEVSSRNEVPLRTELEFVDRYLEIQQTRFGERLHLLREVDPGLMDALLPPLLLQPLVENAIRYGIESSVAGGTISLRAIQSASALRLEVCDSGDGLKAGQLLAAGSGVGLANTKARLQELYGDKHRFKLIASQPAGACVEIEIPLHLSTADKEKEE
jgi:sensor histidine kinase YesM